VLVRDGLARVIVRRPLARLDELQRAEQEARAARRGIWRDVP
jgi:endonuclease YncB( thermonuclease family)